MEWILKQENIIKEFNDYLSLIKGIKPKSRSNYVAWARWLMERYDLVSLVDETEKKMILEDLKCKQKRRKHYNTPKAFTNFQSTLNRFLPFNQSRLQKETLKSTTFTIDQLIDNIACQDTAAHACIMNEAIRLLCIDYGIALTEEQLQRMKANTKSQTAGPNQYNQFFGADSNGYIINN